MRITLSKIVIVLAGSLAIQSSAQEPTILKTQKDSVSYAVGVDIARNFKRQGVEFNQEILMKGLADGLSGEKLQLTEDEIRRILLGVQAGMMQKQRLGRRTSAEENRLRGEAFLAENQKHPGVVTLSSGLQYRVIKAGDGKKPSDSDTVECNYRGTLIDGTEFYASKAGQPAIFKVKDALVPAWAEALALMSAGSKWQLFVPPSLAYGEKGIGRSIGPNETVIFELELLAQK